MNKPLTCDENMNKPLTCDETQEIRTIMKHIHEMMLEAEWNIQCGYDDELNKMAIRYLPNIEQSYKYFVERSVIPQKKEQPT